MTNATAADIRDGELLAAIDLGSNSFHLLVARYEHGGLRIIDRLRDSVRLAMGVRANGCLEPEYREHALACLARFGQLEQLRFDTRFDLIVCSDVLHYLKPAEIRAGLDGLVDMLEGVAFIEVFTRQDDPAGDLQGYVSRSATWYLRAFREAGLLPCGSHAYLGPRLQRRVAALERAAG